MSYKIFCGSYLAIYEPQIALCVFCESQPTTAMNMFFNTGNPGMVFRIDACTFPDGDLDGIDTTFLKIPAYILCYLLGQSERLLWE